MKKLEKKEIIIIIVFIISIVFLNVNEFRYKTNQKISIEEEVKEVDSRDQEGDKENKDKQEEKEKNEPKKIKVDICGAVKNPGVIILKEGDRVIDAINKAGGLTDRADILKINRSKYVYDSEKIIIPEIGQEIDVEGIDDSDTIGIDKKININTASKEELESLDGIGESISERILKYRQKNNGFKSIEEIMNISGIGQSKFEQIKDSIKVK
ncbi:helix-hairpin-helix domain-containing protein [Paramaledivibacter caminithermalis]|jgi:competence protein ComEA|uniref:Competence protein ComEA n=1 Tax=Paramaledivibacter caminithermalis (strain DSM 15212 / CIP 107654 / DViRD3) TaxID=1121301 RepID=A0A1M6MGW8_PARC5|nr:helix-hairpin-helix domain-containing protein [Paramaledivibacter caminithermalis]SHJ82580.1 competence protein ComEA [Paramaledivibacter caminithermalis DSM 15212]